MKKPQPDIAKVTVDTFIAKTGANRKLKRLWGTTTVKGVEVLHARRHYYKDKHRPANYERLFKFLKVYEDVKDYDGKGLKSAWFTLNKSNGPENMAIDADFIADNLNRMWWDDNDGDMPENLTLTTTIAISENFDNAGSVSGIDWDLPQEEIIEYVKDNYETFWVGKKIDQEGIGIINKGTLTDTEYNIEVPDEDDLSPDDPWMAILSRYALRNSGIPCTIKEVEVGLGDGKGSVYNTLVVTIEIPYYTFTTGSAIVQRILSDLDEEDFPKSFGIGSRNILSGFVTNNELLTQSLAKQVNYYETEDDVDESTVTRDYVQWESVTVGESVYESYWVEDDGKWYLKADVIDNPKAYGTTHTKLNTYIFSLLDTGYKKKKASFLKKLVAIVVFVVAVVVSFVVPVAATLASYAIATASAILAGALVVSLATALFGALGMHEWSMAFAEVNKDVEPLVAVASIIMVVDMMSTAANKLSEMTAAEAASMLTGGLTSELTALFSGEISIRAAVSLSTKAVNAYTNIQVDKIKKISDKNKDLKAEYDKLVEETEMESDVMRSFMNIYSKPATADWSVFSSTYDLPYERGGGILAMGNIQKTTLQATRKADYEESMFDGILLV